MTVPVNDLYSSNPNSLIELYQLKLDPVLHTGAYISPGIKYFFSGVNKESTKIIWGGVSYDALPIVVEGIESKVKGSLPRPTLTISNLFGFMTNILNQVNNYIDPDTGKDNIGQDLIEARLTRIRTLAKYIDDANFGDTNMVNGITATHYSAAGGAVEVTMPGTNPGFKEKDYIYFDATSGDSPDGRYQITDPIVQSSNEYVLKFITPGNAFDLQEDCIIKIQNPYGVASPTTKFPDDVYFINRKTIENLETVQFELRSILDLTRLKLPKRQVLRKEFPGVGDFFET
tara:strand:- start:5809 stop:6669 length:861 start_codon:yes stop_codon:yes gene_type:complete